MLDHCQFILGPEVRALEAELAAFCGARHAVSCASGTDALVLVLMAKGIGPGDAVICPSFTFSATAEVVALVGATPVFADVEEATFNLDPASLRAGVRHGARELGLRSQGRDPGRSVRAARRLRRASLPIAEAENMFVLDDAAQAFGATYQNRRVGALAPATATSFFPGQAARLLWRRRRGLHRRRRAWRRSCAACACTARARDKYDNVRIGLNGRLDTIQAAVLIEKLKIFPEEIAARERVARRYSAALGRRCDRAEACPQARPRSGRNTPSGLPPGSATDSRPRSRPKASRPRSTIRAHCTARRPTGIFRSAEGGLPVTERLAEEVISLPMHAYLDEATQDRIVAAVRRALGG